MSSSVASGSSTTSTSSLLRLNPLASQKAKKEIEKRRGDIKTYTVPVIFAGDLDRKAFYQQYHKKFNNSKKTATYRLQVLRKYPTTVGKFYHELVEHSGRVAPEEFWQRYDYRCCDLNKVLRELQASKQANKKRKKQQQRFKGTQSMKQMNEKTASMSWMNIRSKSMSALKPSRKSTKAPFVSIQMTGTADTADEELEKAGTDHIEAFKRSFGGDGNLSDASPSETVQTLSEDECLSKSAGVASIFRNRKKTSGKSAIESQAKESQAVETKSVEKGATVESTSPLKLVGIWVLFAVLASVALEPHGWMSQEFGNKLCAPIRPGSMMDATDGARTFTAPWWAPASVSDSAFGYLCALDAQGNARERTQVTTEVHPNRLLHRDGHHLSLKVSELDDDGNAETLFNVRRVNSFEADSTGSTLMVEHLKRSKEYDAPWALP